MKKYSVVLAGGTSEKKYYLPIPDGGRVVEAYAVCNAAQGAGTAFVQIGKAGATNHLIACNLASNAAGTVVKSAPNAVATLEERKQIFDSATPVEVSVQLVSAGDIGLTILLDEYATSVR